MITYNQEHFIKKAIESVLMQETNFAYELVIGEDLSTDYTRKLCEDFAKKYPNIIKLLPSTKNNGMMYNYLRTLKACNGKYIAFCEGDDYWIDPLKLQKQVDILEANEKIGLVYTNYSIVDEAGNTLENQKYKTNLPSGNIIHELVKGQFPWTVTVCFRKKLIEGNEDFVFKSHYKMGDFPLWLHLGYTHEFQYLDDVTSCYRRNEHSVTGSNLDYKKIIEFSNSWGEILTDFEINCNIKDSNLLQLIEKNKQRKLLNSFSIALQHKDINLASEIWKEVKMNKSQIPLKNLILNLSLSFGSFGRSIINFYYNVKQK